MQRTQSGDRQSPSQMKDLWGTMKTCWDGCTHLKCELLIPVGLMTIPRPQRPPWASVGYSPRHNDLELTSEDRTRVRALGQLPTYTPYPYKAWDGAAQAL